MHADSDSPARPGVLRLALALIVPLAAATLVALVWLWPPPLATDPDPSSAADYPGTVISLNPEPCEEELSDDVNGCGTARVEVTGGPRAGQELTVPMPNGPGAPRIAEDDRVLLISTDGPDGQLHAIVDHQRGTQLWVLAGAFALAVVAFGRWRGLTALVGLAVTFGVLLLFVVPAVLDGSPPLLVAIVGSSAIVLSVLYLTHGFNLGTTVAVLGTLAALTLTGLLSAVTVATLRLTGITDDLSTSVQMSHQVNMEGLLLAGIVIGSLGVLDDVTVTQAATVREVAHANPSYRLGELYRAGSRVGRAHIASVINTIILAYAGTSLPLLVLVVAGQEPLGGILTNQVIAQEIVRSIVATLGLIAAVPITTVLAALAYSPGRDAS